MHYGRCLEIYYWQLHKKGKMTAAFDKKLWEWAEQYQRHVAQ
ncbi:hypothetical protein ABET51_02845 [Metabacillus fastidiosus]